MSKKVQAIIPDRLAEEVHAIIQEDRHENTSEFLKYVLQEYVWRKQHGLDKIDLTKLKELKAPGGLLAEHSMLGGMLSGDINVPKSPC